MGLQTYEKFAVIESHPGGMKIETYQSPLALVMSLMNHGSLGGGYYGDEKHIAALKEVEKQLASVRESITKQNASEGDEV